MLNVNELKAAMIRHGYTQKTMAETIGVSERTFSTRLKTGDFGSKEIEIMMDALKLDNPTSIFFAK